MNRLIFPRILLAVAILSGGRVDAESFKMQGSPVLAHVMIAAQPVLQKEGIDIKVTLEGSSTVAVKKLGDGEVDFALVTRPLTGVDRAHFPEIEMKEFRIGMQAVALIVPRDVWESGVHALTKAQILGI